MIAGPDCDLWVEVLGEGAPVTVFAHGSTSSTDELRPMASRTPGTRILFDFRGHGRSGTPPEAAGYDHRAIHRDLVFVADTFEATQCFAVSMGAGALMRILGDQPDRFERVAFFIPASIDKPASGSTPALADELETYPLEEVAERALASREMQPLFAARPYWRELVRARILRMNPVGVPRALRAYANGSAPVADAAVLERVRAPALILAHEGDPIHDIAVARRLASVLPNASLRVWPEPLAMYDDLDAFARLIGAFLGG